jgi:LmbE family N-acetylglucosaminyl deacetylase
MKPLALYHAQPYSNRDPLRRVVTPDFYVDVTDREEAKVAMLAKHVSQKQWLDESQGLDSYLQTLRDLDAEVGRMSGCCRYAEGWRQHLHLGFGAAQYDPLRDALANRIVEAVK